MASLCRLTYAFRRHQSLFSPACFSILNSSPHFLAQNSAIPISSPPLQSCYSSFTPTRTNPPWKNTNLRGYSTAVAEKTPIKVGDRLPDATLPYFDKEGNLQKVSISALAAGKKIVLFAVPGAFTVNNAFAVKAWAESIGVDGNKVLVLSDKNRHFTNAMGVAVDLSDKPVGLGVRSRLFSLLAEDGIVKVLHVKEGGLKTISGADDILKVL